MRTLVAIILPALFLVWASCFAVRAQDAETAPTEEVFAAVVELRALLDDLVQREAPPDDEELDRLHAASAALTTWLEEARAAPESEQPDKTRLRAARRLLNRVSAVLLLPAVHGLRAQIELLEAREEPPTEQDLETLRPSAEKLRLGLSEIVAELDPEIPGTPRGVTAARDVLDRFTTLEISVATSSLIREDERLESATPPPTTAGLEPALQMAAAIAALLEETEASTDGENEVVPKQVVDRARAALARTGTLELLPLVEQIRPWVEEMESRRTGLVAADLEQAEQAAENLAERMEMVRPGTLDKFDKEAPPAVVRARVMLRRIVSLELQPVLERAGRLVAGLESLGRPPTEQELAPVRAGAAKIRAAIQGFEELPVSDSPEAEPNLIRNAREMLWHFALIDLGKSVAEMEPLVAELEDRSKPASSEQLDELQRLAEELRPKLRMARGKDEAEVPEAEQEDGLPDVVSQARGLMTRADALRPDKRGTSEEQRDAPMTRPFMRPFRFYGSLRLRTFFSTDGFSQVDDHTSRIGIGGGLNLSEHISLYGRLEVAVNPLEALEEIPDVGESGFDTDRLKNLFPLRLAYVGVELPWGDVRVGKQWSAYWDVAVFSDQLPAYTGTTNGSFNIGDGSVSGTGRSDQTIQYRGDTSAFSYTGQIQSRNLTHNNQPVVDTFGGSVRFARQDGIDVGGAFSIVRDGVDDPEPDQPKRGDQSWLVGARTKDDTRYVGATVSYMRNHEQDDQGLFFDGIGFEFYADRLFIKKLRARLAINGLIPVGGYPGEFRLAYLIFGASYDVLPGFRVFLLPRLSASLNSDGSSRGDHAIAILLMYSF